MPKVIQETNVLDPFTVEIVRMRLESIVHDMGTTLNRTSGSPATTEANDMSATLYDYKGRMTTYSTYILFHIATSKEGIDAILRDYEPDEIDPGDVFIANDPHWGGGESIQAMFVY